MEFEKFEALLTEWKNAVDSEHTLSDLGIETEEFLEHFYVVIETFAELCFDNKVDDIYDYIYDMNDVTIEELYNIVYEV